VWAGHPANNDDDDDGVDNTDDHSDAHERDAQENDTTNDDGVLAGGASKDYTMVAAPTSLALVALATADDPLAQIGIDILDSLGMLVAQSLPTPGLAAVEGLLRPAGTIRAACAITARFQSSTCRISSSESRGRSRRFAPARGCGLPGNFTPPSRAELFSPRSSAFQSPELPERHRVPVFSSRRHHAGKEGKRPATRFS
jgi:hypothetical protein